MKVSALVMAQVFREVAADLPYPVAMQFVADEEVGGRDGTRYQLDSGVDGAFAVIGEHSGLNVVADSKGLLHARLRTRGRAGPGAYPWLGDNALVKLVTAVNRLLERHPVPAAAAWRTTVNVARLDTPNRAFNQVPAGAFNQVPAGAEAWLDIRFTAEDPELNGRTAEQVAAYLAGFGEPDMEVHIDHFAPPHRADHDNPDVAELRRGRAGRGLPRRVPLQARLRRRWLLLRARHPRGRVRHRRRWPTRPARVCRHRHHRAVPSRADPAAARSSGRRRERRSGNALTGRPGPAGQAIDVLDWIETVRYRAAHRKALS